MIKIRAHHLLCLSHTECPGGWYNNKLKKHANELRSKIIKNPELKIKIIKRCDDICKKCPYKKGKICRKRAKINYWITVMDNKVLRKLKVKENSTHKAKDIFNLTVRKFGKRDLKNICKGCEFLKYCLKFGLNKFFISNLK